MSANSPPETVAGSRSEKPRRRPWVFALRLAATTVLLVLLARWIEPRAFLHALEGADLRYLALILLLRPGIYLIRAWRFWHLLQVGQTQPVPLARTLGWHFVSLNLGTFTPAGLGEVSLVYFMRRHGIQAAATLSAMVLDKIITLAMVTAMGIVGAVLYLDFDALWIWGLAVAAVLSILLALPLRRLLLSLRDRVGAKVSRLIDAAANILEFVWIHPRAFAINVIAATFQSLLFTAQIWLGFRMLHELVDFVGIFWLTGLGRLINMLPITLGGLGVYEGSMVLLLEQLGAARESALAAVLVPRTITWLVAGVVIAFFLWRRPADRPVEKQS